MKRILTVVFLMISIYGFGQVPSNYLNIRSRYNLIAIKSDSGFHVPGYSTIPNIRGGVWNGAGNIGIDTVNNKFYFYSGGDWREAGSTLDTTSLSNRINKKLNITDTANIRARLYAGTNITISGTYPNLTIASTAAGGADSSVFATLYRVDTAKNNLRTSIAGKVSGSGTSGQLALWNGTSTITGMPQYTFSTNTSYPSMIIGSSGSSSADIALRDAAGTFAYLSTGGGPLSLSASSTYKKITFYSEGNEMVQLYRPTTYNLISLNGLVRSNDLTVLSNFEGNFHVGRVVPYQVGGNNYHGFTDGTDFRQGSTAFNSFGSFVKIGNNRTNQDHYAAFQNVFTKDSSNTISKIYGFVDAVSEMKGGVITDLYGYYHYSPTVTGGTIDNHYGIYIPAVTGATKNVGAYIESNVGIGTSTPSQQLHVVGNGIFTGTLKVGAYTLPSTDGTSNQVLKTNGSGSLSWQEDDGISLTSLSASAPLSYNNGTGAFSISQADGSTNGYLSSTDWNTFNNKQNMLTNPVTGTGSTGQVAFFNGTSTQIGDNGLFWDNTNKRLGIGTTAPTGKLDIQGLAINDLPTYSAEFLLDTGWTSTGWTGNFATGWTHTTGNTTVLSQSKVAVNATKYQIAYTVTGRTAGSFTIGFGGQTSSAITATGAWGPTTSSTNNLTITPTTDFNGTIVISIKSITAISTPLVNLKSSDGTARIEMRANTTTGNTFIGLGSGRYNTTGGNNTANGVQALYFNTTGVSNTANGFQALYFNTTGVSNTANGFQALFSNTTGSYNTANGVLSLFSNTTGGNNTANGVQALYSNTTGNYNTANGVNSLYFNTTGVSNTANGVNSLYSNTTGNYNTANGYNSLYFNTTGVSNTANGYNSLYSNTTGSYNTALGYQSARYIADGTTGRTTGNNGLYLGYNTKASADGTDNEIVIGYNATGNGSNSVTLGNDNILKTILKGNVGIGTSSPTTKLHVIGRFASTQGADVASAAGAISLGTDGNTFEITGTSAITLISNTGWVNGAEVTLLFTSTATLTDGTANSGTDIGMELAGNTNFVASADDVITLVLCEIGGTQRWREKSRSVN